MRRPATASILGVLALLATACGGGPEAPRIDDREFSAAAARLCGRTLPTLRPDLKGEAMSAPETATMVEERADALEALVDDLDALDVSAGGREAVAAWLADWRAYVSVGHRYADALRTDDPDRYTAVAAEGEAPQRRISAFARENGMADCALDGVPLPERRSPL